MLFFRKKCTIDQLSCKDINTVIQTVQNGETKPWANVQILVIDDLEFAHTDGLQREYGFNIRWMKDITPDQAKDFDIVLCDQEGVGRMLSKNNQGGALAREIKSRFPMKYVVLYTASGKAIGNSDILKVVDNAISPGADLDDFAQILKEWCAEVMDPKKRWIKLREILLGKGVSIHAVAQMEDRIVYAWNKNPHSIKADVFGHIAEGAVSNLLADFVIYLVKTCAPLLAF